MYNLPKELQMLIFDFDGRYFPTPAEIKHKNKVLLQLNRRYVLRLKLAKERYATYLGASD